MNFFQAIIYGDLEKIKYFLSKGEDINLALIDSAYYGHIEAVKYLIEQEIDDNTCVTAFRWSVIGQKNEVIKFFIEKNIDINVDNGITLIQMVYKNNIEMIQYLLQEGANIKVLSEENQIKYKKYCSVKIVLFLLDFHFKRELILNQNYLADCNILLIVFSFC